MYQSAVITAHADVLAEVATFAGSQGWTVDNSTPTAPKFTHPTLPSAVAYKLTNNTSGGDKLIFSPFSGSSPTAQIEKPVHNAGGVSPTMLHMFIDLSPAPYIGLTIEYGFNLYRHLYFGYMEKIGNYTMGEVVAAATPSDEDTPVLFKDFTHISNQYLFRGRCERWGTGLQGGVHIVHADNPNPWREFWTNGDVDSLSDFLDTQVFGGFMDSVNDGLLWNAQAPFIASNLLVPCNLYAIRNPGANAVFVPIGRPAGVRMVNMKDLDPGTVIDVGGDDWRVFPAYSKRNSREPGVPPSGINPTDETSLWVGYAYPE